MTDAREQLLQFHEDIVGLHNEHTNYEQYSDIKLVVDVLEELFNKYEQIRNHTHRIN